ncbi:MAG: SIR2 family protein [Bacteroidetes bacterium]|nr:SIR2 family protein [Bacteroidota bacterium]
METNLKSSAQTIDLIQSKTDKSGLSIFCGAGISMISGIPTVLPLVRNILEKLNCSKKDIKKFVQGEDLPIPFEAIIQVLKEHLLFEKDQKFLTEFTKLFFAEPNPTHYCIAGLLLQRRLQNVITTNFDTCIEKAYARISSKKLDKVIVYIESEKDLAKMNLNGKIIKIHGCATHPSSLGTTVDQITKTEFFVKNRLVFDRILQLSTDILFLGYSCSDKWDVTNIFQESRRSLRKKPNLIFWQHLDPNITSPTASQKKLLNGYHYTWTTEHTNLLVETLSERYGIYSPKYKFHRAHFLPSSQRPKNENYVLGKVFQAANFNTLAEKYLLKSIQSPCEAAIVKQFILASESLGDVTRKLNRTDAPKVHYRASLKALVLFTEIGNRRKSFLAGRLNRKLGVLELANGHTNEAIELLGDSINLIKSYTNSRLTVEDAFEMAEIYNDYGYLLYDIKKHADAEKYWTISLDQYEKLSNIFPQRYLGAYCMSLNNLAAKFYQVDDYEKAIAYGYKCLKLTEQLADINPIFYNEDLGRRLNNLGCYYRDAGVRKDALFYLNDALRLRKKLAQTSPETYLPQVAYTLINLGVVYQKVPSDKNLSLKHIDKAISILTNFRDVESVNRYFVNVSKVLNKWGIDGDIYLKDRLGNLD